MCHVRVVEYDILVTNPPYSGDHKQKLLQYISKAEKPFCLLLPVYVAAKSYWRDFVALEKNKLQVSRKNANKPAAAAEIGRASCRERV